MKSSSGFLESRTVEQDKRLKRLAQCVLGLALVSAGSVQADKGDVAADEETLREAKVETSGRGLLEFFRSRSLDAGQQKQLETLLTQLGSDKFATREQASLRLVEFGPPARPYLQRALLETDAEVVRRAQFCLDELNRGPGPTLTVAAVRLLAVRNPPEAVPVLLTYLPFNDDDMVEEEILRTLTVLAVQGSRIDPTVLGDPKAARRSAAAYALGRVGTEKQRSAVHPLLRDPDAKVRLRAAQGLVAGKDKSAVPVLIALLADAPLPVSWQAEDLLHRIAQDQAPAAGVGEGDGESRKQSWQAWAKWWQEHESAYDLSRLTDPEAQLGLTVIAEMDTNKVWECGPDNKPRWKLERLQGPIDAHALPGGRVLVAENRAQRVTERDLKGAILWQKQLNQNPIACQRLPNGNTFVATYQTVMEFTRDGREVFSYSPAGGTFLFGAQKLRNGHIVCIGAQNVLLELDGKGAEVRRLTVPTNGNWCSVEGLPGGHLLVAIGNNKVAELDGRGAEVWSCAVQGACSATRLTNGNSLVACMGNNRVVEVDRKGNKIREIVTEGRPFRAHWR
jgi:hypothetical protein